MGYSGRHGFGDPKVGICENSTEEGFGSLVAVSNGVNHQILCFITFHHIQVLLGKSE